MVFEKIKKMEKAMFKKKKVSSVVIPIIIWDVYKCNTLSRKYGRRNFKQKRECSIVGRT